MQFTVILNLSEFGSAPEIFNIYWLGKVLYLKLNVKPCWFMHNIIRYLNQMSILFNQDVLWINLTATTLTSWHLMVTFCTLHVAQRFHFFEPKLIDAKTVVLFGILNGMSIGFLNLSLGFNSIGFYQASSLFLIYLELL